MGSREWSFPRDHGAHPDYRTEWWYYTGNLADADGNRYGYQLTIFRQSMRKAASIPENPWSARDLYLGHLAVTDAAKRTFRHDERLSRSGPGLAGASTEGMKVWVLGWSATMENENISLKAQTVEMELDLTLRPRKPIVLQGANGLSKKGPTEGQASFYASFTDLATTGTIRTGSDQKPLAVEGTSWFDQEFGSNQLAEDQAGWDWVSMHISDGRDIMLYLLRKKDGAIEPASSGTLIESDGKSRHLELNDFSLETLDRWKSPKSGATYPSRWRLLIPSVKVSIEFTPILADQELTTKEPVGVAYWEGAVEGSGSSADKTVECKGYVEMTGYASDMGGFF